MATLAIASIRTDGDTQPRGHLNEPVVERYAEAMAAGMWDWSRSASPIVVFDDGSDHWLADGFHRLAAAKTAGLAEVECDIIAGTLREARWYSFSVNAEHGYARDREDVARILKAIFDDDEWRTVPLREIARHTRIPVMTVQRHHEKHVAASVPLGQIPKPDVRTVTRGGSTYTMDTGAIGKPPPAAGKEREQAIQVEVKASWERRSGAVRAIVSALKAEARKPRRAIQPKQVLNLATQLEDLLVEAGLLEPAKPRRKSTSAAAE